ncbi:MAG TPA: hypothetical protein DCP03_15530 [Polaromonas sp.]|uniref:hypothetical protein n=1 Tax=Polaromonas sp. UBA4122 TaxID=1947074 RepID=UPI000EE64BDC|nr:hypothetical protein [Polaromonas sp. UBA4122]HAL39439.1 hypothetical protein [Polaromonas sp.]
MTHIFTITAKNYLSLALTLGQSVARHHPEALFTICVADGIDDLSMSYEQSGHRLIDARTVLPDSAFNDMAFKYDVTEFCTSFKPAVFKHLFDTEPTTDLIYYMDPDTRLYSRLDSITEGSPEKTLYLAPHLLDCRIADDNPYPEYHHLWEGIFNLGFCAIRRTAASRRVLDWWDARLGIYCYSDYTDGLHTDQKWMDYAPAFFTKELQVVRHYGVNVAHWNLIERPLTLENGMYYAGPDPLIFFHFSGFDFKGDLLNKGVPLDRQKTYSGPLLNDFARDYRQAVKDNGYEACIKLPYTYGRFDNGTPISKPHRRLYREYVKHNSVQNPFSIQGHFYLKLCDANLLDSSPAASANYSKATVSNLSRKLQMIGFGLRLFARTLGFRRYAQMVKLFGFLGRFENHNFLLDKQR